MAFQGFQNYSGPARPPSAQIKFGSDASPPPPFASSNTPPFNSSPPSFRPTPPSSITGAAYRPQSTPPGSVYPSIVDASYPLNRAPRPNISGLTWERKENGSDNGDKNAYSYKQVSTPGTSRTLTQGRHSGVQELSQTKSPPFLVEDRENVGNYNLARKLSPSKAVPPSNFVNRQSNIQSIPPDASQRPTSSPAIGGPRSRSPVSYADLPNLQEPSSISLKAAAFTPPRGMPLQISSRLTSPPVPPSKQEIRNDTYNDVNLFRRPSVSTATTSALQTEPFIVQSQTNRIVTPPSRNNDSENIDVSRPSLPKRTRSPPTHLKDRELQEQFNSTQSDADREIQAKAKRMARFKVELREDDQKSFDSPFQKLSGLQPLNSTAKKAVMLNEHSDEGTRQYPNDNSISDYDAMESTNAIIGLCPDMCPESERAERERKGDLDQYERLDGDRNQTNKSLAVKKYTRTAEREAILIRPMPILEKTIQYLLSLLDNPYDDKFLGMYNFLWDRMRAIRMDLRMQHIFNQGAITMLEQMIRLHILAMHELCEYTKGEGFSEGFDAHLNIEQMNKTSVELFQMYDDHRKKGIAVPTEKEFRGYYALLKLDKHPGYKVEPAELSLDLAKMTSELRQQPEILFAREVARACRTGNFVAFFRLARKATYLQACLMHAHFAKLRTQALAALHGGLLTGQGIPVSQVSQWLGLEEDDVVDLLDYHGFSIKDFDVPYMVKEGPMLNSDKDYPTKCSNLVHLKKSRSIVDDIISSKESVPVQNNGKKVLQPHKIRKEGYPAVQPVKKKSAPPVVDVHMIDQKPITAKEDHLIFQAVNDTLPVSQVQSNNNWVPSVTIPTWGYHTTPRSSPVNHIAKESRIPESISRDSPRRSVFSSPGPPSPKAMVMPFQADERSAILKPPGGDIHFREDTLEPLGALESSETDYVTETPQLVEVGELTETTYDKEVAEAKLKLIIRLWRCRALNRRDLREKRVCAANAALNSLSLGLPFRSSKHVSSTILDFNINHIVRERYEKHEKYWSPLNVSEVVADRLCQRNPEASCLCFKLIICSQMNYKYIHDGKTSAMTAGLWLHSKLIPDKELDDDDLLVLSPDMAIWNTRISNESSSDALSCLSVIKDVNSEDSSDEINGVNAVLFLFEDSISLELQRARLHNLIMSFPSGSRLPLLILCGSCESDVSDSVTGKLDLCNVDETRISEVHVMFLSKRECEPSDGFYSDDQLMNALQWLASKSLVQPTLHRAELRDVVLNHLKSSVDMLKQMNAYEAGPEHCISAFNWALDKTVQVIVEASKGNPTGWPCPEILLLDNSSRERQACELYLPTTGWSSPQKTEALVSALNRCKLPALTEDLTWLNRGSHLGEDLDKHAMHLEHCLVGYLTESAKILGPTLAKQEVRLLLQKNTTLELRDSSFYLVPDWVAIYQRIFNWQLMSIPRGKDWAVYLPSLQDEVSQIPNIDTLMPDATIPLAYTLDKPSLDEMLEEVQHIPEANPPQILDCEIPMATNYSVAFDNDSTHAATDEEDMDIALLSHVLSDTSSEMKAVAKREADRLSELLDSCNTLQNSISKKLSLYF